MIPALIGFGAFVASAAYLRERRRRRVAERLGAATAEALLNAIDANDSVTGAHVRRVAAISLVLGDALGLDERACRDVERVALFHDVGKIHEALFDILHDSTDLTAEERRAISTHPQRGADVLEPLEAFYPELRDGVLAHHERWDGRGYPRGLSGYDIPLSARIVAIADAFDAITHNRRYHDARSEEAAAQAILSGRGTQFEPELVDLLLSPPILQDIRRARRLTRSSRPRGSRRKQKPARPVPDVIFRWRTPASALQSPDHSPAH